jgi:hypothetical protein
MHRRTVYVKVTAPEVGSGDLVIDSTNTSSGFPERTLEEDNIEDVPGLAGKIVVVNDTDRDRDGVPDFADMTGVGGSGTDLGFSGFVPVVFTPPAGLDLATAKFYFSYDGSDPAGVSDTSEYNSVNVGYSPAEGGLRLWRSWAGQTRNPTDLANGGQYIAPDAGYSAIDLGYDMVKYELMTKITESLAFDHRAAAAAASPDAA